MWLVGGEAVILLITADKIRNMSNSALHTVLNNFSHNILTNFMVYMNCPHLNQQLGMNFIKIGPGEAKI